MIVAELEVFDLQSSYLVGEQNDSPRVSIPSRVLLLMIYFEISSYFVYFAID